MWLAWYGPYGFLYGVSESTWTKPEKDRSGETITNIDELLTAEAKTVWQGSIRRVP
jgi:hypothetical protein